MTIPIDGPNITFSNLSDINTQNNTSNPPWNEETLQDWCQDINSLHGMRESSYLELLECIYKKIRYEFRPEDYALMKRNLLLISQMMPQEIKGRERIKVILDLIFSLLH